MTQNRVSHLTILHCHKEDTDNFDLTAVANKFASKHGMEDIYLLNFLRK